PLLPIGQGSDPLELRDGALVGHIARVQSVFGLEQEDPGLLLRDRHVLDSLRNDEKLVRLQRNVAVAKADSHPALHHEEHLVFLLVVVPDELALDLDELDRVLVDLSRKTRGPTFLEPGELFGEVDLFHLSPHGETGLPGGAYIRPGSGIPRIASTRDISRLKIRATASLRFRTRASASCKIGCW